MKKSNLFLLMLMISALITSCSSSDEGPNTLTEQERQEGWQLLFDGKTTTGWHLYNQGTVASAWEVKDGVLICDPESEKEHGDLVSDASYENFELKFEWQMGAGGNGGVFINVLERNDLPNAWASGPEYQLLDPAHADFDKKEKRAGCLYSFSPQLNPVELQSANQWNNSVIKQSDGKIEFYLNGKLTAKQDFKSQEWKDLVANSGFKNFPEFGKLSSGQIALQDWNKGVSFRNIKIREL